MAALLSASLIVTSGCERAVEVQTGVRVECPYGHVDEDGVVTERVPAKTAGAYRVRTEKRACDRHARLETLYAQAQAAIEAGDLETAAKRLEEITADDPAFKRAAAQLEAVSKGERPATDTAPGTSKPATVTPKPGDGDTSGPIGALKKYTPDSLDGYDVGRPMTDPLSISREYTPSSRTDALTLMIFAEQLRTAAEAKRMLDAQMASGYTAGASSETAGRRTVRFGTDGRSFAAVGFTEGAILVVLEMAARDGVDPITLKSAIMDAASALP
jgi:hypothetical protein